jgi:hypothetical protein
MSDEAHFHLSGFVNKQNFRYLSATNPTELHERPLHSSKGTVWWTLSSFGIISPYFFEDEREKAVTVTAARYVHMLENFLGPEFASHPVTKETFLQQDQATSHTARNPMEAVRDMFPNHVTSRFGDITWPARSPDLSACDFPSLGVYEISSLQSSSTPHSSGVETSNSPRSQTNSWGDASKSNG